MVLIEINKLLTLTCNSPSTIYSNLRLCVCCLGLCTISILRIDKWGRKIISETFVTFCDALQNTDDILLDANVLIIHICIFAGCNCTWKQFIYRLDKKDSTNACLPAGLLVFPIIVIKAKPRSL